MYSEFPPRFEPNRNRNLLPQEPRKQWRPPSTESEKQRTKFWRKVVLTAIAILLYGAGNNVGFVIGPVLEKSDQLPFGFHLICVGLYVFALIALIGFMRDTIRVPGIVIIAVAGLTPVCGPLVLYLGLFIAVRRKLGLVDAYGAAPHWSPPGSMATTHQDLSSSLSSRPALPSTQTTKQPSLDPTLRDSLR